MNGKKPVGWRGESLYHKLAAKGLSPKGGMKRPNHKMHKIKLLLKDFSSEAYRSRNPRKLFGIAGKIAKMRKG